jgi:hypothetical protein
MNEILSEYLDVFCIAYLDVFWIAYLDDIWIYLDNLEQHRQHICLILKRVEEVGLILKASKCKLHTDRTKYLRYIISPMGLQMDLDKIQAVAEWKELSLPDIRKSTIYDITIESNVKLRSTVGSNIVASSLITCLPD